MFVFIVALLLLAIAVVALFATFKVSGDDRVIAGGTMLVAGGLGVLLIVVSMFHQVDSGRVLVVRTFGEITDQRGEGAQLVWPWQTTETWNIQNQLIIPDSSCSNGYEHCLDAVSADVQDVYVQPELNISISPVAIQELARNVGTNYKDVLILNRLAQITKEETKAYKAEEIPQNRDIIRDRVRERMRGELEQYSITVIDLTIPNLDFSAEFKASVERKVVAEQDALRAQAEARRVKTEASGQADAAIEQARGEAEKLRVEAAAQADANQLITQSLTPELIQWQTIQKLASQIDVMIVPDGGNLLFQLPQLTGGN